MNRAEKIAAVEKLNKVFQETPHLLLARFRGLGVNQANELRQRIRSSGGSYTVFKNRLARRAAAGTPAESLAENIDGPCALAAHDTDPVALAKALSGFAKDYPQIELLAGLIDAKEQVDASDLKRLASLPGINELRAQLLALVMTPATMVVRLLNIPGTQLARVIDARRKAEESGSETEGADAPVRPCDDEVKDFKV